MNKLFLTLINWQGSKKNDTGTYLRVMVVSLFLTLIAMVGLFTGTDPRNAFNSFVPAVASADDLIETTAGGLQGRDPTEPTTFKHSSEGENRSKFYHAGSDGTVEKTTFKHLPEGDDRSKFAHAHSGTSSTHEPTTFKHSSEGENRSKFYHAGSDGTVEKTTFKHVPGGDDQSKFAHAHSGTSSTHEPTTFKHSSEGENKSKFYHAGSDGHIEPPTS
jgi:hypothetical protein